MRCPSLDELPPPASGMRGWPWTEEEPAAVAPTPDDADLPRLTIVTPSFNQGEYLEQTIRSVLLQRYPNLEYMVIDGGSTDGSRDIIRKYEPWLSFWVSEPDHGQADALGKGFSKATGSMLGWINSDDIYLPGALATVGTLHRLAPHALVAGSVINLDVQSGRENLIRQRGLTFEAFLQLWKRSFSWHQPGLLFPRAAYDFVGGIDRSLRYSMDHDLLCRLLRLNVPVLYTDRPVARFRLHRSSKTSAENTRMALEIYSTCARYWHLLRRPRAYYGLRMLLHLFQRSGKCLLRGSPQDARASLVGGLRLFAATIGA